MKTIKDIVKEILKSGFNTGNGYSPLYDDEREDTVKELIKDNKERVDKWVEEIKKAKQ